MLHRTTAQTRFAVSIAVMIIAAFLFICLHPTDASASVFGESIEFSGQFRSLTAIVDENFLEDTDDILFLNVLRLIIEGNPSENIEYEIHMVQNLTLSTGESPLGAAPLSGTGFVGTRYRGFDLDWNTFDWNNTSGDFVIDRCNIKLALPRFDLTLGRQAISFGKAYFWNPLDIFLPFNAQQVERDYKGGVDAVRLDVPLSAFSGINLVFAPGRVIAYDGSYELGNRNFEADYHSSALLGRYYTTYNGWDYALQGGKVYSGYQAGGGLVGEIGDYQIRGEATYLVATDSPPMPWPFEDAGNLTEDNLIAVIGIGRLFPNSLDIEVEYLYNGAGDPADLDASLLRIINGSTLHLGRNYIGALASYEFDPLIKGQLVGIHSFSDSSSQLQPVITYSIEEDIDFTLGAIMNFGAKPELEYTKADFLNSEFGSVPGFYFVEYKYYF